MKILKEGKTEFEIAVGEKVYKVRLKDVQIDPITDKPIHFDFYYKEEN
jgi:large subunit ribosomal protein L25